MDHFLNQRESPMPSPRHSARLPTAIALFFAACALSNALTLAGEKDAKTVTLTVDFGDGFQKRYTALKHTPKMTVLDALTAAGKHSRPLDFKYRGKGETAFVTQIDGLKNDGAGRNWIFRVGGKQGKRSCGITPLKAGDHVAWGFERYRP